MAKRKKRQSVLEERLTGCTREDALLFVWLCTVRCLPFIEWNGTFNYWPQKEQQKFLMSLLKAVDVVAFATYDNDAFSIADYVATDVYDAYVAFEGCDDATILITVNIIAESVAFVAGVGNRNVYDAIGNAENSLHVSLETILLQDLDDIESKKQSFHTDLSIYGDSWDNFQTALRNLDCAYWADWYMALFTRGFMLNDNDKTEIKLRLTAPFNIVAQGAASVSKHIKASLPMNEEEFTKQRVIPALSKIGMLDVRYNHGTKEYGRDVVYQYNDNFGKPRYGSAQVKLGDISGKVGGMLNIIREQIEDSFKMKYKDVAAVKEVRINQVVIVCSGKYTDNAKEKILESVLPGQNVVFLDGQDIDNII